MRAAMILLVTLASVAIGGCDKPAGPPTGYATMDELKAVEARLVESLNAQHRLEEELWGKEIELDRLREELAATREVP
jgi:hypothetical protein